VLLADPDGMQPRIMFVDAEDVPEPPPELTLPTADPDVELQTDGGSQATKLSRLRASPGYVDTGSGSRQRDGLRGDERDRRLDERLVPGAVPGCRRAPVRVRHQVRRAPRVAIAQWTSGGVARSAEVQDADGANGNCAGARNLAIAEGVRVTVFACARNGANGALQFCAAKVGTA
jgi:hypothetical protein